MSVHVCVSTRALCAGGDRGDPQPQECLNCPRRRESPRLPCPHSAGCQRETCVPRARPSPPSLGLRVQSGKLSEIVNHRFLAGCSPLLIQVAITHSEYLATNWFFLWRRQNEECFALTRSTFSVSRGRGLGARKQ